MKLLIRMAVILGMFPGALAIAQEAERKSGLGPEHLPAKLQAPATDAPSDEEFAARRAAGNAQKLRVVPKPPQAYSLAELSQFLGEGGSFVILPKGSVIHSPEGAQVQILKSPQGQVTTWAEFLVAHRAWLTTCEVSQPQIRGEQPFTDEERAAFKKGGKVVVATFRGNPVTVLPPVDPPP